MKKYIIEKINGDNRRPNMKYPNGWLIRYNAHEAYGWLSCETVETEVEAIAFAKTL